MDSYKRNNKRWNIHEVIRLQREYELLELSIQEIAKKHERSERAILCKLEKEGFIDNWTNANGFNEYAKGRSDLCCYYQDCENTDEVYETETENKNDYGSEMITNDSFSYQLKNLGFLLSFRKFLEDISFLISPLKISNRTAV
jgi:hypothetical protein